MSPPGQTQTPSPNIQRTAPENPASPTAPLALTPTSRPTTQGANSVVSGSPRPRQGTVARLPKLLRDRINQMLDDGFGYAQIVEDLSKHAAGLNAEHVRRWRSGGYQDYLREQRLIHQCVARTDHILGLLRQPGQIQPFQATQQMAAAQICQILAEIGPDTLRDALQSNPLNYFRMLNAFSRLTTGSLNCQRMLTEQAQINATPPPSEAPKKGLSPETLKQMNDKLHLL